MHRAPKNLQPAILGGLLFGVLSALPIIKGGNACCCLWVITGGVVAAYLLQANHPYPITLADGAMTGALAGIIGAFLWVLISIPIDLLTAPLDERMKDFVLSSTDLPESMRQMIESMQQPSGPTALKVTGQLAFGVVVGCIFSTIGGILGAVFFQKTVKN